MKCPECGQCKFRYDSFEDTYTCVNEDCKTYGHVGLYYPKDIGINQNKEAGYKQMKYPSEITVQLRWHEYPGIDPEHIGYYTVCHGTCVIEAYWDGESFYNGDKTLELLKMSNSTIFWTKIEAPEGAKNNEVYFVQDKVIPQKELSEEEKQIESDMFVAMCQSKGINDPPSLRLPSGLYNPEAFNIKYQG